MICLLNIFTNVLAAHLEVLALKIQDTKNENYARGFADGRHEPDPIIEWSYNE